MPATWRIFADWEPVTGMEHAGTSPDFRSSIFAETPSVAMLEMAHYLPSPRLVPPGYRLGVYEVSDEVALERWHVHDLREGWDRYPHPRSTRRMGTLWLMRKEAPLLAVPSAAVPGGLESIVLANPNVLDEGTIRLSAKRVWIALISSSGSLTRIVTRICCGVSRRHRTSYWRSLRRARGETTRSPSTRCMNRWGWQSTFCTTRGRST